jgi:hypothetical protein
MKPQMKSSTIKNYFLFLLLSVFFISCKQSNIDLVKSGNFDSCPKENIQSMVEGLWENPVWTDFKGDDGKDYVNVTGTLSYNGKNETCLLQFLVSGENFNVNVFQINGVSQDEETILLLIDKMCNPDNVEKGSVSEENTNKTNGDYLKPSDVLSDNELEGKKVSVTGVFAIVGQLGFLYEEQGSITFIQVDFSKLNKEDKKNIYQNCGSGCETSFLGVIGVQNGTKTIIVEEIL